jgi:hypothetical protein
VTTCPECKAPNGVTLADVTAEHEALRPLVDGIVLDLRRLGVHIDRDRDQTHSLHAQLAAEVSEVFEELATRRMQALAALQAAEPVRDHDDVDALYRVAIMAFLRGMPVDVAGVRHTAGLLKIAAEKLTEAAQKARESHHAC